MSDGFLGRWSRRKLDAREGRSAAQEPPAAVPAVEAPPGGSPARAADGPADDVRSAAPLADPSARAADEPAPPPPTMEDVQALTAQSDFSRFAARDVAPEVKNAALRKLFADPHYNVMDGLDVYIDDYSKPDPLPDHMLRQLAGAAFLRLFDAPPAEAAPGAPAAAGTRDVADNPTGETVSKSQTVSDAACEPPDHADPDLRLQPDDAPAAGGTGQGAA